MAPTFNRGLAARLHAVAYLRGTFTLRSGEVSDHYFDKYRFESDPRLLREVGEAMAAMMPPGIDALAGLELGGVPLVTILSQVTGLPALFVRKAPKPYGTCRCTEGGDVPGRRLMIVEDVVTSGGQVLASARMLRAEGAIVENVACVIDRGAGSVDRLAAEGLTLRSLFTGDELEAAAAQPAAAQ